MNAKAEKLSQMLEEAEIKCFQIEELEDEAKTAVFRSQMEIAGQMLPTAVILDESVYAVLRVQVAVVPGNDQDRFLNLFNELNGGYKAFKYYINADNHIIMDCYLISSAEMFDPQGIRSMLDVAINHLNETYPQIMKKRWSEEKPKSEEKSNPEQND